MEALGVCAKCETSDIIYYIINIINSIAAFGGPFAK